MSRSLGGKQCRAPVDEALLGAASSGTPSKASHTFFAARRVMRIKGKWEPTDKLEEGQSAWIRGKQDTIQIDLSRLRRVVVRDQTGRTWKGKITRHPPRDDTAVEQHK